MQINLSKISNSNYNENFNDFNVEIILENLQKFRMKVMSNLCDLLFLLNIINNIYRNASFHRDTDGDEEEEELM